MSAWGISILLSALIDFLLGGAAFLTGFMVANGTMTMPTAAAWLYAALTGIVTAGKDVQSKMSGPAGPAASGASAR